MKTTPRKNNTFIFRDGVAPSSGDYFGYFGIKCVVGKYSSNLILNHAPAMWIECSKTVYDQVLSYKIMIIVIKPCGSGLKRIDLWCKYLSGRVREANRIIEGLAWGMQNYSCSDESVTWLSSTGSKNGFYKGNIFLRECPWLSSQLLF